MFGISEFNGDVWNPIYNAIFCVFEKNPSCIAWPEIRRQLLNLRSMTNAWKKVAMEETSKIS